MDYLTKAIWWCHDKATMSLIVQSIVYGILVCSYCMSAPFFFKSHCLKVNIVTTTIPKLVWLPLDYLWWLALCLRINVLLTKLSGLVKYTMCNFLYFLVVLQFTSTGRGNKLEARSKHNEALFWRNIHYLHTSPSGGQNRHG